MNFVTIGDVHFDTPLKLLSDRMELGEERRLEQRKAFKKAIEYVKENKVEYLFFTGDLYESQHVRSSTIEYINNLFKEIPFTKIFITPGNHDPYTKNSYYATFNWEKNVKIFTSSLEIVENDAVDLYGLGFSNYELRTNEINNVTIKNPSKINILITHGDIYNESNYNPIDLKSIKDKFDYIALGHIHKRDEYYPGSLISLGFDEPGEHGFIYGEIDENKHISTTFIKADDKELIRKEIDVSNINSEEDLIEKINETEESNLYEIILTGYRNIDTNLNLKLLNKNIIKLKDETKVKVEINKNKNTLSGIFQSKLQKKFDNKEIDEGTYEKIFELANKIMEK